MNKLIYSTLAILFGAFMFVFGEIDDSPGAQLLGVILFVAGILIAVKNRRKNSN